MRAGVADVVVDLVVLLTASVGASVLAGAGVAAERAGLASLFAGHLAVGLWYVYVGGLALYVGCYLLGYRQVLPRGPTLARGRGRTPRLL